MSKTTDERGKTNELVIYTNKLYRLREKKNQRKEKTDFTLEKGNYFKNKNSNELFPKKSLVSK